MNEKLFMPVILGTARDGRQSEKVAQYVVDAIQRYGFETELVDVRNIPQVATEADASVVHTDALKKWQAIAARADGFIIVSPEYNHSLPGELKMLIDALFDEYRHKVVAFCGVSSGRFGGVRMVEAFLPIALTLHLTPIEPTMHFGQVESLFDDSGLKDKAAWDERMKGMFDELAWYGRVLKAGRQAGK